MSIVKRIAQNTLYLGISEVIHKIAFFFLIIYATSVLGPVEFGKYSFAFSFAAIATLFIDLGISEIVKREIARDVSKASKYLGNLLIFKLAIIVIVTSTLWLGLKLTSHDFTDSMVLLTACLAIFVESTALLILTYFNAREIMLYEALMKIIQVAITVSLGFYILMNGMGLLVFTTSYLIGNIIALFLTVINYYRFSTLDFRIDMKLIRDILKKSLPLSLAIIFGVIYFKIDTLMLTWMKGDYSTGIYSSAYNIFAGLLFIIAILSKAVFPQLSKTFLSSKESFKRILRLSVKYALLVGIPIATGISVLSSRIINLLYDSQYTDASGALVFIIWAFPFMFVASLLYTSLVNMGEEKKLMKIMGSGAILNIALNTILISRFDYVGAGIATVVTQFIMMIIYYNTIIRHNIHIGFTKLLVKPILSAAIMGISLYLIGIESTALYIIIPIGALIYTSTAILLFTFNQEDLHLLQEVIGQKK